MAAPKKDIELDVIATVTAAMERLDQTTQLRVLSWLAARLGFSADIETLDDDEEIGAFEH